MARDPARSGGRGGVRGRQDEGRAQDDRLFERNERLGIGYLAGGDAAGSTPLVMLHGIGSNARSFVPLMRALRGRRALIAWDAPGYGGSDAAARANGPTRATTRARCAAFSTVLRIERIDLLGHSLGALIAGRFRDPLRGARRPALSRLAGARLRHQAGRTAGQAGGEPARRR